MRPARLALLGVAASVAAGAGHAAAVRPEPSAFVVRPSVADRACNGGHGVRVPAGVRHPVLATAAMADGSTLVALSPIYPDERYVVLHSVTASCAPDASFGARGSARVAIAGARRGLWVDAAAPRKRGGAILAGTYGRRWVVGEVDRRGGLDRSFGNGGWEVLPFRGGVTAVLQEPSGRILIAGGNGGGGCCTRNFAAALSARGRLERGFGTNGRVELPTGEDSAVTSLLSAPSGDALAEVGYGNMGCWGMALSLLTPSGRPAPGFAQRLARFWRTLAFDAFVGDVLAYRDGFAIVGTGQRPCAEHPFPAPPATGLIARFRWNGERAEPPVRFVSRIYGDVRPVRHGNDVFVVASPYADPTRITVEGRRRNGSLDARYGDNGRARVRTPWRERDAALDTTVSIDTARRSGVVIVAARDGSDEIQLIRVRF